MAPGPRAALDSQLGSVGAVSFGVSIWTRVSEDTGVGRPRGLRLLWLRHNRVRGRAGYSLRGPWAAPARLGPEPCAGLPQFLGAAPPEGATPDH
jgi:hypothetical protein